MMLRTRTLDLFALVLLAGSALPPAASAQQRDTPAAGDRATPRTGAPRSVPGGSTSPRPPATHLRQTTRSTEESDAAARDMEAELEPTPGGLTAQEAVNLALENSPALAKSQLEYDKAAANRARARLAFAPRVDLSAGYTRLSNINPPVIQFGPDAPPVRFPIFVNQYAMSARASLPITEIFLTIVPTLKATKGLAEAAEKQVEAQRLQVSYDARVAFYEYARLRGNAAVARASVRVREAGVRDLQSLVQAGTATQTELVRAQAELANAQVLATQAEGGVTVARARLEQLTGTPIDPSRGIGEPFVEIEIGDTPSFDNVLREARNARPELLALSRLEEARSKLLRARRGATAPKIQAVGGVLHARPNQRFVPMVDEFRTTWDVGVNVSWSPNDALLAYTQATDAETDLRIVREDRRLIEQGIAIEAAAAVTGHRTAVESIVAKTEALEAARRYEADQRALLLAGAATPNDVLLAQRDLLAASLQWVDAFIAGRIAQAALLKAQGQTGLANATARGAP